ncbi:MAG: hypothetical protein EON59_04015 [Alphaproteobacteria bacterium]|nr:MAG: hypothetical protein EON59_04015 [Alphaproteobacteria bacterium]
MSDMLKVIEPKSDQINADDLLDRDMIITITGVQVRPGTEQPVSMTFEGSQKVFRPCKTVSRIIVKAWGADTSVYAGRSIKLYRDPGVKWGGLAVGGIRVRAISHINEPLKLALAESKQNRKISVIEPLVIEARKPSQTPDQWLADHLAAIEAADTLDALAEVQQRADKALDKLRDKHPTLHDRARTAAMLRTEALTPGEGRTDADHGEQHNDDATD